jgi:membrane-bound inhibitor of C-type lysozyme
MTTSFRRTCIAVTIALAATSGAAYAKQAHYDCSGGMGLTAQFSPPNAATSHVVLTFDGSGRRTTLPQVLSADGGRYANDKIEFWIKGNSASLTRGGNSETCTTQ